MSASSIRRLVAFQDIHNNTALNTDVKKQNET